MAQEQASAEGALPLDTYIAPRQKRFDILNYIRREPVGATGAFIIILIVLMAIFAPLLHTTDPRAFGADVLQGPNAEHWFGTDARGRDIWSRVLYGARISLKIGVASIIVGTFGGTLCALMAGTFGGKLDFAFSRVADVLISFPALLFVLTIKASFGDDIPDIPYILSSGEVVLVLGISVIFIPTVFRLMRGAVLEQRGSAYVEAARVTGSSESRIMLRHITPNLAGLMIVITTAGLPATILLESTLSFLGVGVPVGTPSWGADLSGSSRQFFVAGPWIAIFPGLALSVTVFAFNILGDSLRDVLDPRLRGKL